LTTENEPTADKKTESGPSVAWIACLLCIAGAAACIVIVLAWQLFYRQDQASQAEKAASEAAANVASEAPRTAPPKEVVPPPPPPKPVPPPAPTPAPPPAAPVGPAETKASHILVATQEEAVRIREEIVAAGGERKAFSAAARKYSKDPTTKTLGGDVGWFRENGAMDRAFTAAALQTPVGGITQPVQTQFGWHLILVTDRKPR